MPALGEALSRLSAELKQDVVTVLDDIDRMSDEDQRILSDELQDVIKRTKVDGLEQRTIRIVAEASRPKCISRAGGQCQSYGCWRP